MTLQWLFGWWNVIYLMPFLIAFIYLALYMVTGVTFGDADADASTDAHADAETDAHVDAPVDLPAGGDVEVHGDVESGVDTEANAPGDGAAVHAHDAGHGHAAGEHAHDDHPSARALTLSWLGVGRVPLSLILMTLLMTWGLIGFAANQFGRQVVSEPSQFVLASLPIALVGSLLSTGLISKAIGHYLPTSETYARRRHELLGEVGQAVYEINDTFGMAAVRDSGGDRHQIACRVQPGADAIPKGSIVVLVGYHGEERFFYVAPHGKQS